jgi:hypothetical protein
MVQEQLQLLVLPEEGGTKVKKVVDTYECRGGGITMSMRRPESMHEQADGCCKVRLSAAHLVEEQLRLLMLLIRWHTQRLLT